jgi:hypothetical protein
LKKNKKIPLSLDKLETPPFRKGRNRKAEKDLFNVGIFKCLKTRSTDNDAMSANFSGLQVNIHPSFAGNIRMTAAVANHGFSLTN